MDKVLFSYPTLLKEELEPNQIYLPEPLITGVKSNSTQSFVITAGLALQTNKRFVTELDILFEGSGRVMAGDMSGKVEHPVRTIIQNNQLIYLSSMYAKNVAVTKSGCYEISVTIYSLSENDEKSETVIDRHSSFFFILTEDEQ